MKRVWKSLDYSLVLPFIILCTLGVIMVYSTSSIVVVLKFPKLPVDYFFVNQLKALGWGMLPLVFFSLASYQLWRKRAIVWGMYAGSIALLVLLLFFGTEANGKKLWLWGVQPSEFVKIAVIIIVARFFARRQETGTEILRGSAGTLLYIFVVLGLVVLPDLGTSLVLAGMLFFMLFCSGIRADKLVRRGILLLPAIILVAYFGYKAILPLLPEYQQGRFIAYHDPFGTQATFGYQMVNSFIAIASGGFSGQGLGNSIQKLGYLPEPHTDFIMSIVSEELGFLGVFIILGCLLILVVRSLRLAQKLHDPFGSMIAIGIGSMFMVQTFINVGGITGLIPLTGVPLPFISSGGSSLMANCIAMGLLFNVSAAVRRQEQQKQSVKQEERPRLVVVK